MKNLLIKTDRLFHIVALCTEWPSKYLFETIFSILWDNFSVCENLFRTNNSFYYDDLGKMEKSYQYRMSTRQ